MDKGCKIVIIILALLLVLSIIINIYKFTITMTPNICPDVNCGEKFTSISNLEKLLTADKFTPFGYGGYYTYDDVFGKPKAFFSIKFNKPFDKKCSYESNNVTTYQGICSFCNLANPPNENIKKYRGMCNVAYNIIISKNKINSYIHFNFNYGDCSKTVSSKLGTVNSIIYNGKKDNFITNITTISQTFMGITLKSRNINIELTNPVNYGPFKKI